MRQFTTDGAGGSLVEKVESTVSERQPSRSLMVVSDDYVASRPSSSGAQDPEPDVPLDMGGDVAEVRWTFVIQLKSGFRLPGIERSGTQADFDVWLYKFMATLTDKTELTHYTKKGGSYVVIPVTSVDFLEVVFIGSDGKAVRS